MFIIIRYINSEIIMNKLCRLGFNYLKNFTIIKRILWIVMHHIYLKY